MSPAAAAWSSGLSAAPAGRTAVTTQPMRTTRTSLTSTVFPLRPRRGAAAALSLGAALLSRKISAKSPFRPAPGRPAGLTVRHTISPVNLVILEPDEVNSAVEVKIGRAHV